MDPTLLAGINKHLELEFQAFYEYLAMSHWLELNDLPGFAHWLQQQSAEELDHAQKFITHLLERDQVPILPPIAHPGSDWDSPAAIATAVYESEREVTRSIEALCVAAESVGDRPSLVLLQWFVSEQVEEEAMAKALLGRLNLVGGSGVGLLMIDQELAQGRVGGQPPQNAEA